MENEIRIYPSYGGHGVEIRAVVKGIEYVVEEKNLQELLLTLISQERYTTEKTKQQKLPRIYFNEDEEAWRV